MALELSFKGVHLPIDGYGDVVDWVNAHLPPDEFQQALAPNVRQTRLGSITRPTWGNHSPRLKLNQWFYPVGLSRWGQLTIACTKTTLDQFAGSGSLDGTLKMSQGDDTIQTTMTMLPPRPVCQFGGTHNDVYLVTFVDDRYWMQWKRVSSLSLTDSSTWSGLVSMLGSAIGASLSFESIATEYLKPSFMSDLAEKNENAALLADAVATNVGQRIVRTLGGSYQGQLYATAHSVFDSNTINRTTRSGGLMASTHSTAAGFLPETVEVCFPKAEGRLLMGCQQGSLRHPVNAAEFYTKSVTTSSYAGGRYTIPGTIKTFIDTAVAQYPGGGAGGSPSNQSDLDSLAAKITEDYVGWSARASDVTYNTLRWTPEGSHDVIWEMGDDLRVRAFAPPLNWEAEYLCHYTSKAYPRIGSFYGETTGTISGGGSSWVKLNGGSDMVQVYSRFTDEVAASAVIYFGWNPLECRMEVFSENCTGEEEEEP